MTGPAERPELSVIIPVRNGARYLGETITSVLHQGIARLEVIVLVDDASEDDSAAVAEAFVTPAGATPDAPVVECVRHPPLSLAAARNEGLSLARGPLVLHLDADDLLTPGSLAVRLAVLAADSGVEMVTGSAVSFVSPELPPEEAARYSLPAAPQRGGLPGTSIVRAACVDRVGPQDTSLSHSADLDWMIRAEEAGVKAVFLPNVVLRRRIHGGNMSLLATGAASRLSIVRAALERRSHSRGARPE